MRGAIGIPFSSLNGRQDLRVAGFSAMLLLAACGGQPPRQVVDHAGAAPQAPAISKPVAVPKAVAATKPAYTAKSSGGYYQDDGPGDNPPPNLLTMPDARPKWEALHKFANKPYSVLGHDYLPMTRLSSYKEQGMASWYGRKFHGQKTSSGEIYDMYGMTAAHPTLPIPSYARVTHAASGESVVVRVNDRGPFHVGRVIDLSYTAAAKLGIVAGGSAQVEVESIVPGDALLAANASPRAAEDPIALIAQANAGATAATEPARLPETRDARGFFLQLGAFGNPDNAENLKARLTRELPDLSDKLLVQNRAGVYRVHLGPWPDHVDAQRIAERLRATFEVTPMVMQH